MVSVSREKQYDIESALRRYYSLRRHAKPSSSFNQQLDAVASYQGNRMRQLVAPELASSAEQDLLDFVIEQMVHGMDLSHYGRNVEKLLKFVDKVIYDKHLLHSSIEMSIIAGEIDEAIAGFVFHQCGHEELDDNNFADAYVNTNVIDLRHRQAELLKTLVQDLDENSKNKMVYASIKLAKGPAKISGFGKAYDVFATGYKIIRQLEQPSAIVEKIVQAELSYIDSLKLQRQA